MPAVVISGAETPNGATVLWQQVSPDVTASGSASGYPAINITDPATWSSWKASGSNGWIKFDFGSATNVDGVGISAHNLATSGVTGITVESSTDDSTWVSRATYAPLSDADVFIIFPAASARYWRVSITGPAANIGVLQIGKRLVFPHPPLDDYVPLHHSRKYTKLFNDSIKGHFLSNRVMSAGMETDVDMGMFDRAWLEANIRPFESHYNQGGTFFYAGCPSKYPLDIGYCRALEDEGSLNITWIEAERLSTLTFGIRAYAW